MNWAQIYKDVQNEIAFLGYRIEDLEKEYTFWYRNLHNGYRKPVAGMAECLRRMDKIKEDSTEYSYLLEIKTHTMKQMDEQLKTLEDNEYKVIKLSLFEGKKLLEVAEIMDISEIWAKKLSSRARKKLAI